MDSDPLGSPEQTRADTDLYSAKTPQRVFAPLFLEDRCASLPRPSRRATSQRPVLGLFPPVRRGGFIVLIATWIAGGARADEPATPAPDLKGEIAWARATWPDVFQGVRFRVPMAKLRAWAPPRGEVEASLFVEEHCIPLTIERERLSEDDEGYGQEPPGLTGRIGGPTRGRKGHPTRSVKYVDIGEQLTADPLSYSIEEQDARGRWRSVGGTSVGVEPNEYGWLSYVDDRVARWSAQPYRLHISCPGPVEWLDCAAGGGRSCKRCDGWAVSLLESDMRILNSDRPAARPASCTEPCPPSPAESPDIARLRLLDKRVQ